MNVNEQLIFLLLADFNARDCYVLESASKVDVSRHHFQKVYTKFIFPNINR